uniref:DNA-directed RNA polymerase subunit beta n=1 Tax=Chenopodium quinoa TaxID=63459 RepID=A0A803LIM8_CHEQI
MLASQMRGLVKEHLDSYNYFISTGIKKIVRVNNEIRSNVDRGIYLKFLDVKIGEPSIVLDGVFEKINPQFCRLSNMTYAAPIEAHIEYVTETGGQKQLCEKKDVIIGRMPIMLRSRYCVLYGKDETELAKLGECPLDPGGYFVVKGNEKVIMIQEQLSNNRIIIEVDKKGNLVASVTSLGATLRSKTVIMMEKEKIYLHLNRFQNKVPIMVVMKAMGIESDQEVVQMIGRDPRYSALLLPSIEECASFGVKTQRQALEFLEKKVKKPQFVSAQSEKEDKALKVLQDIFIAHVPMHGSSFRAKCIYAAVMMRRMLEAFLNKAAVDDKDYVGNKRFELSGQLLSTLFEHIIKDTISFGLERALSTGNWCIKRFRIDRKGVTQVLARLSYIQALGFLTKIQPQFEKSRKVSGPRALQPSQWGMLCPCDTPEGESCGLVKNLALMTHVTTDEEEGPLVSLCYCLGVEDLELLSGEELHSPNSFLVIFNGLILGKHRRPQHFASALRRLRRSGKIGEFVSIFVNEKQCCVYIASDGGRVCRPLVIADKGVSRIKHHHMKELLDGVRTFDDFLREGLIEYLDVNEENNALVKYDKLGAGQNATVAVMSYTGYDIEDAIVMNKSSLDRGFGRCIVMKKKSAIMQRYENNASERILPPTREGYAAERMQALDDDGIAAPGQIIRQDDFLVNKSTPKITKGPITSGVIPDSEYRPTPFKLSGLAGDNSVIDRVALFADKNSNMCINFIIRQTRRPEVGDKFSSRHGQKGVCGTIVQQEDFVFSERGICPDLIMNPHGFPSRMTVGKMIELLGGKAGVSCGRYHYGSAFGEPSGHADKVEDISETLVKHGFSYSGKDFLYSAKKHDIEKLPSIFPLVSFQLVLVFHGERLQEVLDKMHARGFGPRAILTRQPTEGKARNGGLRVGEMERDCLIAYGASNLIYERLMISSDPFQVCRSCGLLGYYNHKLKAGICSACKNGENISTMKLPYACKLLFQELQSMNIVPRLKLSDV